MHEFFEVDPSVRATCLVFPESQLPNRPVGQMGVWLGAKGEGVSLGKRMPPGGHFEHGQTPGVPPDASYAACAVREASEEWSIAFQQSQMRFVALCWYDHSLRAPKKSRLCFHFAGPFDGVPTASSELGSPKLYDPRHFPKRDMWPADRDWIHRVFGSGSVPLPYIRRFIYDGQIVIAQRDFKLDHNNFRDVPLFDR